MMSWSPTAGRRAVSGLAHLWCKTEWRSSGHADEMMRILTMMLTDKDAVNRLHAAQITPLLGDEDTTKLELIKQRLLTEQNSDVAAVLMHRLAVFRQAHPVQVDSIVGDVIAVEPWASLLKMKSQSSRDSSVGAITGLALYLALRCQTPTATGLVEDRFRHPTASDVSRNAVYAIRPWLELPPDRVDERSRAFVLLRLAAKALNELCAADPSDRDAVREIYLTAHSIIGDIYFASGAYAENGEPTREPTHGFAEEAFSTLAMLTDFREPSIVHQAIETLAHLAPIDPPRAFLLVNAFIKAGDAYTYDSLAADAVIALIERYLAEFREHVMIDSDLLTAVRSVLDAFVHAGWPAGVALSYRLGDAFR